MHQIFTLKNGLTVITIDLPHLDSITTMVAVGAGSRNEAHKEMGIAHFFEHMFFKGSRKYPSALEISTLVDSIGAVNNAFTGKEYTGYYVKSAARNLDLSSDLLSSSFKEPILDPEEIDREKGVIIEERRMILDTPARFIWDLFFALVFGNNSLGWNIVGSEDHIKSFSREDFISFIKRHYGPSNMALILVGKVGDKHQELAEKYFSQMPEYQDIKPTVFKSTKQIKPRVDIYHKQTDQVHVILGGLGYGRSDPRRYAATLLATILGEGMSSRLFIQVRERRGLAYNVVADMEDFRDCGLFAIYAGLKLEKALEGVKVIKAEVDKLIEEPVLEEELKKVKEMQRGHMALREESTNFLAQYYGLQWVLDRKIETPQEYLAKLDQVTAEEIQEVAQDLLSKEKLNLQIIGPVRSGTPFEKVLAS